MRRLFISDCSAGDVLEDVYVISGKQLAATQNNKLYIKGMLSDRSGGLTLRMWSATRHIFEAIPDGGLVHVRARVENYQNNLQVVIDEIGPPREGAFDLGDLIPHTDKDIGVMFKRVGALVRTVRNRHLRALVEAYLADERLMADFSKAPAAQSFHHAFIGGLLEHTLNACEIADAICRFYPLLNRDLVVVGLFLHDIAKTWELRYECAFGYTDGGQLVGHIVKSALWLEDKAREAGRGLGEEIPRPLIDVLQHILLSHHGDLANAFGSAKTPSTPEAMMVHFIDDMDAKLMLALDATRGNVSAEAGSWTEYLKAFSGRLYRPDLAPPDDGGATGQQAQSEPADAAESGQDVPSGRPVLNNPLFEKSQHRR